MKMLRNDHNGDGYEEEMIMMMMLPSQCDIIYIKLGIFSVGVIFHHNKLQVCDRLTFILVVLLTNMGYFSETEHRIALVKLQNSRHCKIKQSNKYFLHVLRKVFQGMHQHLNTM